MSVTGYLQGNDTAIYNVLRKVVVPTVSYDICRNSSGVIRGDELCTANTGF